MATKVTVNKMTVVHRGSDGISQIFPDVCKTPAAPSPLPLPYPNIALSKHAADTATSVSADGNPLVLKTSKYALSSGDEAGSLLGVMSNRVKGSANPQSFSMDVKVEGQNVFRQLDLMLHNGGSKPTNTPPGTNMQPPASAQAGDDEDKCRLIKVEWKKPKRRCGDVVDIATQSENALSGTSVRYTINRTGDNYLVDTLEGELSGDADKARWITKNGPWRKEKTTLQIAANSCCGVAQSQADLVIERPAEKTATVKQTLTAKALVPMPTPTGTQYVNTGKLFGNTYGYDISIARGALRIHCKIALNVEPGVNLTLLPKWKRKWQKIITAAWDRRYKEHRTKCQRGDKCDCPGGCCLFPIRVTCAFVAFGGHVTVNLKKGAAAYPSRWWNAANWYEFRSGQEGNGDLVYAHEFGHNIGMWDEYAGGSILAPYYDLKKSLMGSGSLVMQHHFSKHPSPDKSIHKWFLDAVGENYRILQT